MSLYNRNNNTAPTTNNSIGVVSQPGSYQQTENEFMSRNVTTPNHIDNSSSVQLTRPTSKTAMLVRQRRAMLEQLSCHICKGYLIDATTIDECMDSFCKSCIVTHLTNSNNCPKCGLTVQQQHSLGGLRSDKVLQDVVYKLIPGLYDDEMKRRREFYREYYGAIEDSAGQNGTGNDDNDDDESSTGSLNVRGSSLSGEKHGVITHPKPFYKPSDSIDLSIEPQTRGDRATIYYDNKRQSIVTCFTGSLQQRDLNSDGSTFSSVDSQLFKTYLRCPARLTVLQLKKFIAAKFNICPSDTIRLLYLNESLKDEYSLIDVAYIYDWRGIEHMQLFYIIERDLSKMVQALGDNQLDRQTRAGGANKVSRRIEISTQTTKRVCIDPQPKFYEEKNNNTINHLNESTTIAGRSMRARTTAAASTTSTNTTTTTTAGAVRTSQAQQHQHQLAGASSGSQSMSPIIRASPHRECKDVASIPAKNIVINNNNNNIDLQIVPFVDQKSTTISVKSATTQSSLVTLASFTKATMSTSSSSATTIAQASRGLFNSAIRSNPAGKIPQASPQLAFSFVTERGIKIVRCVNGQAHGETTTSTHTTTSTSSNGRGGDSLSAGNGIGGRLNHGQSVAAITANAAGVNRHNAGGSSTNHHHNNNCASIESSSQPSTSHSSLSSSAGAGGSGGNNDAMGSSRHHIKVKPVYKTFVDPTKLKSPNLKKLGFTARH